MELEEALSFKDKSSEEICTYLEVEIGIPQSLCDAFKEEYVDGAAFIDLTEDDVKSICKKIGPARKICSLISEIKKLIAQRTTAPLPFIESTPPPLLSPTSSDTTPCTVSNSSPVILFSPSSVDSDECSSVVSSVSSRDTTFHIPTKWRPSIMQCITASSANESRKLLSPSVRNEIVRDLVSQMYSVWSQPVRSNCTHVAKKLVQTYSFMKDEGEGITGYGSWERKIIDRVHNTRGTKRKASTSIGPSETKRGRPKVSQALNRYPPVSGSPVDETSLEKHVQKMKGEMERENPRKQVLLPLMEQSYLARREMILENTVAISSILDTYPCLKLFSVIQQEVDLILKKKNVVNTAMQNWKSTWVSAIMDYVGTLTTKSTVNALERADEVYKGDDECDEKKALFMIVELLCRKSGSLPFIFDEFQITDNPEEVATRSKHPTPWFGCFHNGISEASYFLFIEGQIVSHLKTFSRAFIVWFVSFFIFNLEYPKEIKDVASFIQEFVFLIPCQERKKTATYLSVTTGIKNFTEQM